MDLAAVAHGGQRILQVGEGIQPAAPVVEAAGASIDVDRGLRLVGSEVDDRAGNARIAGEVHRVHETGQRVGVVVTRVDRRGVRRDPVVAAGGGRGGGGKRIEEPRVVGRAGAVEVAHAAQTRIVEVLDQVVDEGGGHIEAEELERIVLLRGIRGVVPPDDAVRQREVAVAAHPHPAIVAPPEVAGHGGVDDAHLSRFQGLDPDTGACHSGVSGDERVVKVSGMVENVDGATGTAERGLGVRDEDRIDHLKRRVGGGIGG